jgi:hypothetical protein
VDYAIGDLLEELNDCKHHLAHNAKQVEVNQYLTKRIEALEQELKQACAAAMAPAADVAEEIPDKVEERTEAKGHCKCPKCHPPEAERAEGNPFADILNSLEGVIGAFGKPYSQGGRRAQMRPTNRVRSKNTPLGKFVERLWQSADEEVGEWRAEALASDADGIHVRVF